MNILYEYYNASIATRLPDKVLTSFYISYIPDNTLFSKDFHYKLEKIINLRLNEIRIDEKQMKGIAGIIKKDIFKVKSVRLKVSIVTCLKIFN